MRFIKIALITFRWKNNIVKAQEGGWTSFSKIIVTKVLNNKYEQKKTNNKE